MTYNMFLDDERFPPNDERMWIIVRSFDEAIQCMETDGCCIYCSFDHDLGENSKTGYDLVNWMIETDLDSGGTFIPREFDYYVHSQNPVGRNNIISKLANYLARR